MPQQTLIPENIVLHKMNAPEAFAFAASTSGLSFAELCKGMQWSKSYGRRVFRNEKFYPSFEDLPRFCSVVGNTIVLQWALARAMTHGLEEEFAQVDCQGLLVRVMGMFADAGVVATRTRQAVADNLLTPHEIRRIVGGLDTLTEGVLDLLGDLRHQLQEARHAG